MATAKSRERRRQLVDQTTLIWAMWGGELTEWQINEYIRCGQIMDNGSTRMPALPEVDLHMAKIQAAGKFVMPDPPPAALSNSAEG